MCAIISGSEEETHFDINYNYSLLIIDFLKVEGFFTSTDFNLRF